MVKASKALTAQGLIDYHENEHLDVRQSLYYSENNSVVGLWRGKLAADFGLSGGIQKEHFERLAFGHHPFTDEVLVKHREYKTEDNKLAEHRAGWDFTVSAPKTISATALVGGDRRVRQAHREAVDVTLREMEHYVQAQFSRGRKETTENWIVAVYPHDSSRPVKGAVAPQLHDHCVVINMSRAADGKVRSLDPQELFRIQSYGTAIYRAELAHRVQKLGYQIEFTQGHSFEIKGYTPEYITAISPRREQITEVLRREGLGKRALDTVVVATREKKLDLTAEQLKTMHREQAEKYGHQPDRVVTAAREYVQSYGQSYVSFSPDVAITYAKNRLLERTAVFDEYEILRDSLQHGLGKLLLDDVQQAFSERVKQERAEFLEVTHHRTHAPGHRYTTPEMARMEKDILERIHQSADVPPVCREVSLAHVEELQDNPARQKVLERILTTQHQFVAIQGSAGARKTSGLKLLQPYIEAAGYELVCYAPTGGAANELTARKLKADTLQALLASAPKIERPADATNINRPTGDKDLNVTNIVTPTAKPRYYVLDEASLADTEQIHQFMSRVRPGIDHVLFVGDDSHKRRVGQHKSVGAGRIFHEMQMGGMKTAELNRMYRQITPDMQRVASLLRDGKIEDAVAHLDGKGRVHEVSHQIERWQAMARDFAANPARTYIVEPRNDSRQILNEFAREAMQAQKHVGPDRFTGNILVQRDTRKEDTLHARCYEPGDVIQYPKGNKTVGVKARDYATVLGRNDRENLITVRKQDGRQVTYDPKCARGVQLYSSEERRFAVGERIQFTSPLKDQAHRLANRDTGTILKLDEHGNARIRLDKDNGRCVRINLNQNRHLEYAYAMTSHSLQGKTLSRVIYHVECDDPRNRSLLGKDMTYTALTRGESDAVIYTDHKDELVAALSRECVKPTALAPEEIRSYRPEERREHALSLTA